MLAHARALLTSSPEGATAYLDADLREVGKIRAQAAKTLEMGAFEERLNQHLPAGLHVARPQDAVAGFFDGAELLAPGVVRVSEWRPEPSADAPAHTTLWGGVARKP